MSSNVPLLIELHETVFVSEEKDVWSGTFMVDICHISSIEQVRPTNLFMSTKERDEWLEELRSHKIQRTIAAPAQYYIPASCIVKANGHEIKVIEAYEEIREKIAKAGVIVP